MRTKKGIVTSAKMNGTVAVNVTRLMMHPKYQKRYRVDKKFLADSNGQEVNEGDLVLITECRPLSKRKCFKVTEILKKAAQVGEVKEESEVTENLVREKVAPVVEKKEEVKSDEAETPAEEVTDDSESDS